MTDDGINDVIVEDDGLCDRAFVINWSDLPLLMPPKMTDRVDAVEERLGRLELSFDSFRETLLTEIRNEIRNTVQKETPQSSPTTGSSSLDEFRLSGKKVELPSFNGDDPIAWITRAETYFEVQRISEDVRIQLTKLSMEGPTIHWFNLWMDSTESLTWEDLKDAMMMRFGAGRLDNPFEELKELKQTSSVEEYIAEFELYSSQCGRLPEQQFLGYFVGGLRHDIRSRVRTFKPRNRYIAMKLARDVEAEFAVLTQPGQAYGSRYKPSQSQNWPRPNKPFLAQRDGDSITPANPTRSGSTATSGTSRFQPGGKPSQPPSSAVSSTGSTNDGLRKDNRSRGVRHIPFSEVQGRRSNGLCFRCNERWNPLHQCATKQLRLIILADDEGVNEDGEVVVLEAINDEEREIEDLECKAIGLFGLTDTSDVGVRTMKLEGFVQGASVLVLIDSGATHNFISPTVVEALGLPITNTKPMGVRDNTQNTLSK